MQIRTIPRATSPTFLALVIPMVLVVALAVVAAPNLAWIGGERIAPGVRAAGVALDGLTPSDAQFLLGARERALAETRVELRAGDAVWRPTLADLGGQLDSSRLAKLAYGVGRGGSPLDGLFLGLTAPLRGPRDLGGPTVDDARLRGWVADAARSFDRAPVAATIAIDPNGDVRATPDAAGRRLDAVRAQAALQTALADWMTQAGRGDKAPPAALDLPYDVLPPAANAAQLAPARDQALRVLGRSWTLRTDGDQWPLARADVAGLLYFRPDGAGASLAVDGAKLSTLVDKIAGAADRPARDASLAITPDGKVQLTPEVPGRRVDRAAAAARLREALLSSGPVSGEVLLPATALPPIVQEPDLAPARAAAERVLAGPIELTAGDEKLALAPKDVAPLLRIVVGPDGQGRQLAADPAPLRAKLDELAKKAAREPRNGRFRIVGGTGALPDGTVESMPVAGPGATLQPIEEGKPGIALDVDAALAFLKDHLARGEHKLALPVRTTPAITSADRAAFGPLEPIQIATTSYLGSVPERSHNIELAATRLDGYVVPPGATFSFNGALGPTTIDDGYQIGWGIIGGGEGGSPKTVPSVGGGICQVATTLFHTVFWSGYQVDERHWHLYWIPRYGVAPKGMKGLDATVDPDTGVDLRWTNNTDHPVIIQARTDGENISFGLYGQKPSWTVQASTPVIDHYKPTTGETVRQPDPTMPAGSVLEIEEARDGFRSAITRTVTAPGAQPRVLTLVSEYAPSRNVILVGTR